MMPLTTSKVPFKTGMFSLWRKFFRKYNESIILLITFDDKSSQLNHKGQAIDHC